MRGLQFGLLLLGCEVLNRLDDSILLDLREGQGITSNDVSEGLVESFEGAVVLDEVVVLEQGGSQSGD